jgi:hypothetical protein
MAVNLLARKDVEFSDYCTNMLIENGIIPPLKDETPVIEEGTSIFDKRYAKYRKVKLPKTVGQIMADVVLSQSLVTLCEMSKEKELWLDVQEFEKRFDNVTLNWGFKNKFKNVESILPIFRDINPDAAPVLKNGKQIADPRLRDTEIIPFRYEGGIEGFLQNEILPYTPDAWIDEKSIQTGYELSFTKYFYNPKQLRTIEEISHDIRQIEERTDGLLDEILGRK